MKSTYTEEFKIQAVQQVTNENHSAANVAKNLGISVSALYGWIKRYGDNNHQYQQQSAQDARIRELEKQLKRVTQERDILKEAAVFFAGESKKNTRS